MFLVSFEAALTRLRASRLIRPRLNMVLFCSWCLWDKISCTSPTSIGQFWGWYRTVRHAAAGYGRDWSTTSGVTPSHMQEVGSLVSRQRIELNQPGKVVVKINVIIKWVVVAPSKTSLKQSPPPRPHTVLRSSTVLGIATLWSSPGLHKSQPLLWNNNSRVSRAPSRRPAPPDPCQATSSVFAELQVNTSTFPIRTATIRQHLRQITSSISAVTSVWTATRAALVVYAKISHHLLLSRLYLRTRVPTASIQD